MPLYRVRILYHLHHLVQTHMVLIAIHIINQMDGCRPNCLVVNLSEVVYLFALVETNLEVADGVVFFEEEQGPGFGGGSGGAAAHLNILIMIIICH